VSEIEAVMGPDGNMPLTELLDTFRERNETEYQDQLLPVIKKSEIVSGAPYQDHVDQG
jgi:hypothetical protein